MNFKKIILTALNVVDQLFGNRKPQRKEESNEHDFLFDEAYYAGTMSYSESQDWKNYWSNKGKK